MERDPVAKRITGIETEGNPDDPETWKVVNMDTVLDPIPVPQVMGDPASSEVVNTDTVLEPDTDRSSDSITSPFAAGDSIKIKRSSGEVDDGWTMGPYQDNDEFLVFKESEEGGFLKKIIPLEEIVNLNPRQGEGLDNNEDNTGAIESPVPTLSIDDIINPTSVHDALVTETLDPKEQEALEREQQEIVRELEALPEEEREKIELGFRNVGHKFEAGKSHYFASAFNWLASQMDSKTTQGRFFSALGKQFTDKEERALSAIQSIEDKRAQEGSSGVMAQVGNYGSLGGNILRIGRIATDAAGLTAGSITRHVMLGSMIAASGAEAAKEARLSNEEVMDKTRIQDIKDAAAEAWAIYESAEKRKADGEALSKEDIQKMYEERIPQDILNRLASNPQPFTRSTMLQFLFQKQVRWRIAGLNEELKAVDTNDGLTETQKGEQKNKILGGWFGQDTNRKMLNNYDRLLSQQGMLDTLGMSALYAEKGAKAVMYGMMADSVYKLWDHVSDMLSQGNADNLVTVGGNPAQSEQGIPLSPAQERFITIAEDSSGETAPYDMSKDIVDVGGGTPESNGAENTSSTPTEKIDPLGPSDGEPVTKTFIPVSELDNGYVAPPETTEKMEAFTNGEQTPSPEGALSTQNLNTERQPPEHLQQRMYDIKERMADFKQEHGLGEGVPLTADEVVQQEINRHDSMMFGEMVTPIPETPSTSFELDNHAKDLLQKETAELNYAANQQVAPTPLDTYTAGRLEKEANIQALVKEINQTPGYRVQPGDNVWKIIENKLEAHHLFRDLEVGQRNHLIDELKNKVANMSADDIREFGIKSGDPNLIKADEYLNFSKILGVDTIEKAVFNAENLSAAQIENIKNYVPPQPDKVSVAESIINQTEATTGKVTSGFEADGDTIFVGEGAQRDQLLEQESGMNPEYDAMMKEQTIDFETENRIRNTITDLYGSKLLGIDGTKTLDWLDMKDKGAIDLLMKFEKDEFPTTDKWGEPINDIGYESRRAVRKMGKALNDLITQSDSKPYEKETVFNFMQRATKKVLLSE